MKWRLLSNLILFLCFGTAFWFEMNHHETSRDNIASHGTHPSSLSTIGLVPNHPLQKESAKHSFTQLDYTTPANRQRPASLPIPGRRIPSAIPFAQLTSPQLPGQAVPLPEANTLAHINFQKGDFGILKASNGETIRFNPEMILVKFRDLNHVAALHVEPMREWDAVQIVRQRTDVQFAELDVFQQRQFTPNDPALSNQWHHQIIGSSFAWEKSLGQPFVRIAIVDTPFQMNHPDLAPNTVAGWDVVNNVPVTSSAGSDHSTISAGMAAAVIGNHLGIAGAGNCTILPININGAASEMYNATIWAADHNVRVVNISWSGADSDTVEAGAFYLKTHARGILAMPGVNGFGFLNYTNQPDIYCISMTDAADNVTGSKFGNHIDFAAPGVNIFSTTTNSGYVTATGTSYATPLFSGIVGVLMSINPTLSPNEIIDVLKTTAVDKGETGWDQFYGWGRVDFGAAATAAASSLPRILSVQPANNQIMVSADYKSGLVYSLWKTTSLSPVNWIQLTNSFQTNASSIAWLDTYSGTNSAFYRVQAALP